MSNILISVIVAIYNGECYIEKCVESIIKQTYDNLEILLINDGSSDNSAAICDNYVKLDKRIKVIHQENKGLSAVRNVGIKEAKGDYIMFVDMDDWVEDTIVEFLLGKVLSENLDYSSCALFEQEEGSSFLRVMSRKGDRIYNSKEGIHDFYHHVDFTFDMIQAKLYKSSLLKQILFDENRKATDDTLITPRIMDKCKRMGYFDTPLYYYLLRINSMSKTSYNSKSREKVMAYIDNLDMVKMSYPESLKYLKHNVYSSAATNYLKIQVLKKEKEFQDDFRFYEQILLDYKPVFSKQRAFIYIFYILKKCPPLGSLTV